MTAAGSLADGRRAVSGHELNTASAATAPNKNVSETALCERKHDFVLTRREATEPVDGSGSFSNRDAA